MVNSRISKAVVFCIGSVGSLGALPSGETIIRGDAAFALSTEALRVEVSGKAIIHWDQFDIGCDETVFFAQSQLQNAVLNRVPVSAVASQILGSLQANCPIYLVNAKGVFIGSSAQIETAGFIASTADISDDAFFAGEPLFFEQLGDGKIVNLGTIHSSQGDVVLIGRSIQNQGSIYAPNGSVTLATTEAMLDSGTKQTIFIRLTESSDNGEGIENGGSIAALSIELQTQSPYERAIHHIGSMQALKTVEHQGRIYLAAGHGQCVVDSMLQAEGGSIEIGAKEVHLTSNAILDVSADNKPGSILIAKPTQSLRVDLGAHLLANADVNGNGGDILAVADESVCFYGLAQARGGPEGGDGGTIHISSAGPFFQLGSQMPIVDAAAPNGSAGHVIFDPKFVIISPEGMDSATGQTFGSAPTATTVISGATLQTALDAANVTIQANTDITFQDVVVATTVGNGLTLQAGRSILFNGELTLNQGDFLAVINDSGASMPNRDLGLAVFQTSSTSQILTQGGDITVDVGTFNGAQIGELSLFGGTLDAGGGNISLTGFARQSGGDYVYGIYTSDSSLIQTLSMGTITLEGTGGNGSTANPGIYLGDSQTLLQTADGLIHLTGFGGGNGSGNGNMGIYSSGVISTTGSGAVLLDGFNGSGVHANMGICLSGGQINTVDGDITLNGTGGGTGGLNFGVRFESNGFCLSTGSGHIALTGTSSNGRNNNHGVILSGSSVTANTGSITITGTGQGSQNYNYGIRLETESHCTSTGTAPIVLQGQGVAGINGCAGISISTSDSAITSGYGDIQLNGTSNGTGISNQGIRVESGQISSTGTGPGAAQIHLTGVGSGIGTNYCNGVIIQGTESAVSSIDGNIIVEGTAAASGQGNQPIIVEPETQVYTTGTGSITYIEH